METELSEDDQAAIGWAVTEATPAGREVADRMGRGEDPLTPDGVAAMRREWLAAGRPAPEHHRHRDVIMLADGTSVTAVSYLGGDPYERDSAPDFGLYLDARWAPAWPHEHTPWPDFGVPADATELRAALARLLDRARSGESVEIGCVGGHGRTGTALACLAVLTGTPPGEAVDWVRAIYCPAAVETAEQRAFVRSFGA